MLEGIIFVDFDDTLCLHNHKIQCSELILTPTKYEGSMPNKVLINSLVDLKNIGYQIILLTSSSSYMLEYKIKWCEIHCPFIFDDFIGLSVDCSKKDYIGQFTKKYPDLDIQFWDDSSKERSEVEQLKNVRCYSPQYIQNLNIR